MKQKLIIADIRSNSVQGKSTGHYIPVARNFQEMFQSSQCKVAGGPVYKQYFLDEDLICLPYNISGTTLCDKWHTMKNCIRLFNEGRDKIIVLQQSSAVTSFIGIVLFYHLRSKLLMIQYSTTGINSLLKRMLYRMAKNKIDGVICPNKEVGEAYGLPYCVVPDYIYIKKEMDCILPFSERLYDLCVVGRISPEKGVVEVAQNLKNTKYKIVIAGRPQTQELYDELIYICSNANNIELHLGYIEDKDYDYYIRQSRYSILNYTEEYSVRSSGVVFDMIFRNTPVIARRCKSLQFIEDENMGVVYDTLEAIKLDLLFNEVWYQEKLTGIVIYKQKHQKYIQLLREFILS